MYYKGRNFKRIKIDFLLVQSNSQKVYYFLTVECFDNFTGGHFCVGYKELMQKFNPSKISTLMAHTLTDYMLM